MKLAAPLAALALGAFAPGLARAAPPASPGPGPAGVDDATRQQHWQQRMRLARTLGLSEALDLDDAATLRARDAFAKHDERAAPIQKTLRDGMRVLRDAARGDQAAAGQVDSALQKVREARTQLHGLDQELLGQLTQGLSPQKKARAALFLARFDARAGRAGMMHGEGRFGGHAGPGFGPAGRGGPGGGAMMRGRGMGPGAMEGPRAMGPGACAGGLDDDWTFDE